MLVVWLYKTQCQTFFATPVLQSPRALLHVYFRTIVPEGKCKSWTLDSGLDYGLIFGLGFGLIRLRMTTISDHALWVGELRFGDYITPNTSVAVSALYLS